MKARPLHSCFHELSQAHLWHGSFRGYQQDAVSLRDADLRPGCKSCVSFKQDEPAHTAKSCCANSLSAAQSLRGLLFFYLQCIDVYSVHADKQLIPNATLTNGMYLSHSSKHVCTQDPYTSVIDL